MLSAYVTFSVILNAVKDLSASEIRDSRRSEGQIRIIEFLK